MKQFVIVNEHGDILRCGVCHEDYYDLQAEAGETIIESPPVNGQEYQYVDGQFIQKLPVEPTAEDVQQLIRKYRDNALKASDWTQMPDAPLSEAHKTKVAEYRQALRDLPSKYLHETDFDNVVFPTID